PLRPFLTTFEEQQKKHFFYHIINNMAQRYEYQDIDGHVILLFVHPASFCHLFRHFSVTMEPHCALKVAKHLFKNKGYYHHNANDRFGLI
ncbi:MAG: hypothetical protein IKB39_03185, partial [Bacteroidaceae bacterium]|nr:hypothetical protein [Bacteroidaceae bacterium]